jgi:endonuclease/exonuclease/phosphatase family metal-dependent hydrolase
VLWKKDKYTKENEGYFWLSDTPTVASPSFVGGYPRIVNWVSLKDKQTGQVFNIYSAHFSLDLEPEHLEKTRMIFSKYLSKLPRNTYAFVMGDFNISYQSEHYYMLTDDVVLADLRPLSEEMAKNGHCTLGDIRNGAYNGFSQPDGGVFGDFILTLPRKNLAIDKFGYCYEMPGNPAKNVGEGYVSDHFAVYTEVRMGSKISYSDYFGDAAK